MVDSDEWAEAMAANDLTAFNFVDDDFQIYGSDLMGEIAGVSCEIGVIESDDSPQNERPIFGALTIAVALAYVVSATQIKLVDPLGPRWFPDIIGGVAVLAGLAMVLRLDEEPEWPALMAFGNIGLACVVLVGYALALRPFGFTALAAGLLGYQIKQRKVQAVLKGVGLSVGLFIFKFARGLGYYAAPKRWLS